MRTKNRFTGLAAAALVALGAVCMLFASCGKDGTEPEPATPLTFTDNASYDIPGSTVGTAITGVNVAPGASGGKTPYTFTATGLPAGITISTAGTISGTPSAATAAGTATVTVKDSSSPVQSKNITINFGAVTAAGTPLSFTDDAAYDIPGSTVGTAITDINVSTGAAGGTTPYTFTATGLPAGITISTAGTISGTPTAVAAAGEATITVKDSGTPQDSKNITIAFGAVVAAGSPLAFADDDAFDIPATLVGVEMEDINVSTGATGGTTPYAFTATGLPAGVTISEAGTISGTPTTATAAGNAIITVKDSGTPQQSKNITIAYGEVIAPVGLPVITAQPDDATKAAGETATFSVTATGATSYRWQHSTDGGGSWSDLVFVEDEQTGVVSATLSVLVTTDRDGCQFRCKVSNDAGDVYSYPATLTLKTVTVGAQQGTFTQGRVNDMVTFEVTTTGIPDGVYDIGHGVFADITGLPTGIVVGNNWELDITDGRGTLVLTTYLGDHVAGTYPLQLTLDCYGSPGATSNSFPLTIGTSVVKSVTVGAPQGTLRAGTAGSITFPVTTTGIDNGTYSATFSYSHTGRITYPATIDITGGSGTLTLTTTAAAEKAIYSNDLTIDGTKSGTFLFEILAGVPTSISFANPIIYTWYGKVNSLGLTVSPAGADHNVIEWEQTAGTDYGMGYGVFFNMVSYEPPASAKALIRHINPGYEALQPGCYVTLTAKLPNGNSASVTLRTRLTMRMRNADDSDAEVWFNTSGSITFKRSHYRTRNIRAYYGADETQWNEDTDIGSRYLTLIDNSEYTITSPDPDVTVVRSGSDKWVMTRTSESVMKTVTLTIKCGTQTFTQVVTLID